MKYVAVIIFQGAFCVLRVEGLGNFADFKAKRERENKFVSNEAEVSEADMVTCYDDDDNILINVEVKPKCPIRNIISVESNCVIMGLQAPGVGKQANAEAIMYLSRILKVEAEKISIIRGRDVAWKLIKVLKFGKTPPEVVYDLAIEANQQ